MREQDWQGGWLRAARRVPSPSLCPRADPATIELGVIPLVNLRPLDWSAHPYFETIRGLEVSAHFLVRRDGEIVQFVSCDDRAWHAGTSRWDERDDCNDFSVGIELEGLEGERFDDRQYPALAGLLADLALRYPIASVAGHEHVAPGRKSDPGPGFDWARLRRLAPSASLRFAA